MVDEPEEVDVDDHLPGEQQRSWVFEIASPNPFIDRLSAGRHGDDLMRVRTGQTEASRRRKLHTVGRTERAVRVTAHVHVYIMSVTLERHTVSEPRN